MNSSSEEASNTVGDDGIDLVRVDEWVRQAQAGDEAAFGELVKTYHTRVYGVAYRMVGNVEDAREVAQLSWVKSWQRLAGYKRESRFFTWIYRITVNTAMDFLRSRARKKEVELPVHEESGEPIGADLPLVTHDTPDDEMARDEVRVAFREALESLSADHKAALVLREVEGKSYQEIADAMGVKIGTVMSRIFYARKAIQQKLRGVR